MSFPKFAPLSGLALQGLGDAATLQQAQQNLTAAGYTGVTCRTEKVFFPGVDPNTGKNYYLNDVCSAPGFLDSFDASVAATQSTAAHPGYGVDLAAERAYALTHGGGHSVQDYYQAFGSGPNTQIVESVNTQGVYNGVPSTYNPSTLSDYVRGVTSTPTPVQGSTTSAPQGSTGHETTQQTLGQGSSVTQQLKDLIPSGINPIWLVAGAGAVVLLLVMANKK